MFYRGMLFLLAQALVLGGTVMLSPSLAQADSWVPPAGAAFNRPRGTQEGRTKLIRQVKAGINHAPAGSTIRFSMYSFDRRDVADALIKAYRRGVHVQLIVNDNWTSDQTRRLRKVLGQRPHASSFYVICHGSCRGGKGNLHLKVYAFSQTGAAAKVLMTGSGNLTDRAVSLQWNDQVTLLAAPELYDVYVRVFDQLKLDRRVSARRITYSGTETLDALFYRGPHSDAPLEQPAQLGRPGAADDPVMRRLRAITCSAEPGYGANGRTVIRVMTYAWNKDRGYLAERLAELKRQGCDVGVITSVPTRAIVQKLRRARIPMKSADYNFISHPVGDQKAVNFYSHYKTMMLDGTYAGKSVRTVWTGSENWSGISFQNDELILHLTGDSVYNRYLAQYKLLWSRFTHVHGIHPHGLPGGR